MTIEAIFFRVELRPSWSLAETQNRQRQTEKKCQEDQRAANERRGELKERTRRVRKIVG